jgi:hypothetical protein
MKPGDLVQAQKHFWASEIKASSEKPYASKLSVLPGDILLIIDFEQGNSEYPIYDYFTVKFFAAGSRWSMTATISDTCEIEDFIKAFESSTLLPRG